MGVDLLMIAGQRLSHFVFACEPPACYDRLAVCSTNMSTWLKTMVGSAFCFAVITIVSFVRSFVEVSDVLATLS